MLHVFPCHILPLTHSWSHSDTPAWYSILTHKCTQTHLHAHPSPLSPLCLCICTWKPKQKSMHTHTLKTPGAHTQSPACTLTLIFTLVHLCSHTGACMLTGIRASCPPLHTQVIFTHAHSGIGVLLHTHVNTQTRLSAHLCVRMATHTSGLFKSIFLRVGTSAGGRGSPKEGSVGRVPAVLGPSHWPRPVSCLHACFHDCGSL